MSGGWPHPPAEPEALGLVPQPAFVVRAAGLGVLAAVMGASGVGLLRQSAWLAPLTALLGLAAALCVWAAAVQWVGSEKVDDHPWV